MQITLKQPEIERALKMFIASQGISLQGRDVDIDFTAGRRGSGVSAEMQISDDPANDAQLPPPGPVARRGIVHPSTTVAEDVTDTNEEEETQEEAASASTAEDKLFGN